PMQKAPVCRNDAGAVFDARFSLEQRLGEITRLRCNADHDREQNRSLDGEPELSVRHENEPHIEKADHDGETKTTNCTLDGFPRTDRRNQLLPSERSA